MNGFISMTIVAIIAISTAVLGGAGYGVYKYQEVQKENEQIKAELDQQKDKEIARLEEELDELKNTEDEADNTTITEETKTVATQAQPKPVTNTPPKTISYTPISTTPTTPPVSEHLEGAKVVMKRTYDDAYSSKANAVVKKSIHQSRVNEAQENIDFGKGYIKVYPDLKSLISYFENIYTQQIEYEKKAIAFADSVIDYNNVIMDGYDKLISTVNTASEDELEDLIEFFGSAQFVIKENNEGLSIYASNSSSLQTQIDGIVSAAQAKNSSSGMPRTVEVVYPEITVPVVNSRIQCYSEGFIGGTLTTCN